MPTPIDATAMAIFAYESGHLTGAQVRAIRNNNPGNLRPYDRSQRTDGDGYRVFDTFAQGWGALLADITSKVTRHLKPTSTMLEFFNLYAPAADHNNPNSYAQFVCVWLSMALSKTITLATTVQEIYGATTTSSTPATV